MKFPHFHLLDPFQPVFPEHTQPVQKPGEERIVWDYFKKLLQDIL